MCGIAGIFHCSTPKPVDAARVERMTRALAHRGPDGSGVWTAPGVGLGHRRLSIIDVAGSPQPMHSADGRAAIAFNGEIYNYRELRRELQGLGAEFRTDGDTEVILQAWRHWGVDCLPRLNGMFAFALHDLRQRTTLLARDRFGVKPLFTARLADGAVIFGSELKAMLAHPSLRREIDPLAVEDYLAWGYVPDHRSILKGVQKLAAGHYQLLRPNAPPSAPVQWWDVSFADRATGSRQDLEAHLLHHMREAVTSRMLADVHGFAELRCRTNRQEWQQGWHDCGDPPGDRIEANRIEIGRGLDKLSAWRPALAAPERGQRIAFAVRQRHLDPAVRRDRLPIATQILRWWGHRRRSPA